MLSDDPAFFRLLADNSPLFIGMCDMNQVPFYLNDAGRQLVGLDDLKHFVDTPVKEFFFPEDQDFILNDFIPRVLREGRAETEIRFRHFKTGEAIWMTYDVFILSDESGAAVGLATVSRDISERKRADEAYRERSRQLDLLVRASQMLALGGRSEFEVVSEIFDELGRIIEMESWVHYRLDDQPRMLRLAASAGMTEEEQRSFSKIAFGTLLCGQVAETRARLIVDDLQNSTQEGSEIFAAAGAKSYIGFPLLVQDRLFGTIGFLSRKTKRFRDGELQMIQAICNQIAVTRQRVESEHAEKLRAAELEAVFDTAPMGLSIALDPRGEKIRGNRTIEKLFGVSLHGELSKIGPYRASFRLFDNGRELSPAELPMQRALHGEIVEGQVMDVLRQDGARVSVFAKAAPLHDEKGDIRGAVGAFLDISELTRIEEALRSSEQRLGLALSGGRLAAWDQDLSTGEMIWNDEHFRMLGYEVGEVTPSYEAWLQRVHPEDREEAAAAFARAMQDGSEYNAEFRVSRPDGTTRWAESRGMFHADAQGRPCRSYGVMMDVTERKQNEETLQEADRRKDEFIATLAHELRNPLVPIYSATSVLRRKHGADGADAPLINMIRRETEHLVRLVDDLLEISRIRIGKIELRRERIAAVIGEALESCESLMEKKTHQVSFKAPTTPLWVYADRVRLSQIVVNLITNAAKYTPRGGVIEIEVVRQDDEVVCFVRDNGIGVPPEKLSRVFDLFAQIRGREDLTERGLGIGLALVRKLVEMHDGRIEAHSDGLGRGSEFVVRLPFDEGPAEMEASTQVAATKSADGLLWLRPAATLKNRTGTL